MRTIYQQHRLKNLYLNAVLFSAVLLVGCSGYQTVSYHADGIYGEAPMPRARQDVAQYQQPAQQSGTYYKNYFAQKANQGVQDDYIFTNAEQYQNPVSEQTNENYQAHGSWGDQTDNINVNIISNPSFGWNWGWNNAPFGYARSAFWGYNYNPWYFSYNHFHNPYYNPYRLGWNYYSPYYNPYRHINRYGNRYGNRYYNGGIYSRPQIYSRVNGGRGDSGVSRSSRTYSNTQGSSTRSVRSNAATTSENNSVNRSRNDNYSRTSRTNSNTRGATTRSVRTNSNNKTTNNNTSRSRNDSYSTTNRQNTRQDSPVSTSRSRSSTPTTNRSNSYQNDRSINNNSYSRTRSSSNNNYSRTSAGSRSSSGGASRSSSSRR